MQRHTAAFSLCVIALGFGVYDSLPSLRLPRIPPVPPIPPLVRPFVPPLPIPFVPSPPSAATASENLFSPTSLPPIASVTTEKQPVAEAAAGAGAQAPVYTDDVTGISVTKPTIIQISIDGCKPCIEFMTSGRQRYIDVGWDVREVKDPNVVMAAYPSYRILNRGKWHTHVGPLTPRAFNALLRGETVTTYSEVSDTLRQVVAIPMYSGVDYKIDGREWTTASLRAHLYTHSNHRHPRGSLDGLPLSYLQMLHTADHENGTSSAIVSQPSYVRESSGGCPPGGCPPQYSRPSYRVFRR